MPNHLPERLETDRLWIRVGQPEDGNILYETIKESYDFLKPWLDWVTPIPSPDKLAAFFEKFYQEYLDNKEVVLLIFEKSKGRLVGGTGLSEANWKVRSFEVGYWASQSFAGTGLMYEAVKALTTYALNELKANRIYLTMDVGNIRSKTLAERLGFECEGRLRNHRLDANGVMTDSFIYSIISSSSQLENVIEAASSKQKMVQKRSS